jgi:hypothetical protein
MLLVANMKVSKDGKSENITIKVSARTKARAMALYEKMDTNMAFNSFLGEMVYITRNERKYHIHANCKTLQASGMIVQTTVGEAIQNGLSPCGKCS